MVVGKKKKVVGVHCESKHPISPWVIFVGLVVISIGISLIWEQQIITTLVGAGVGLIIVFLLTHKKK